MKSFSKLKLVNMQYMLSYCKTTFTKQNNITFRTTFMNKITLEPRTSVVLWQETSTIQEVNKQPPFFKNRLWKQSPIKESIYAKISCWRITNTNIYYK